MTILSYLKKKSVFSVSMWSTKEKSQVTDITAAKDTAVSSKSSTTQQKQTFTITANTSAAVSPNKSKATRPVVPPLPLKDHINAPATDQPPATGGVDSARSLASRGAAPTTGSGRHSTRKNHSSRSGGKDHRSSSAPKTPTPRTLYTDTGSDNNNNKIGTTLLSSSRSTASSSRTVRSGTGSARMVQSLKSPAPHLLEDMTDPSLLSKSVSARHLAGLVPMDHIIESISTYSIPGKSQNQPGKSKTNQDSCFAYRKFVENFQALAGVFDGHGSQGELVSGFIKRNLPVILAEHLDRYKSQQEQNVLKSGRGGAVPAAALVASFLECNALLKDLHPTVSAYSGSTAVVTFMESRRLIVGWVGDSRAMIVKQVPRGMKAVMLTRDHKPTLPAEKERILACGGRVERLCDGYGRAIGPARVFIKEANVPGLAMSRALGDNIAQTVGVLPEPETAVYDLNPSFDRWLIIASDGVFEFVDNQEVAEVVQGCKTADEACRVVAEVAAQRWREIGDNIMDDISCVAIKFKPA
jgi:serine/threonine protein phosphatase PrpC